MAVLLAANAAAIASPPPFLHQAEAATAATLAVKAKTLSGKELNMWTTIRSSSGTVIKTGFTPLYFTGEVGKAYSVTVADYQNYLFSRWADNGSTSRTRTLTLSSSVTLTAYYSDGVSLSGSSLSGACTGGWYITGYFIPVESDYSGTSQVTVWTDASSRTFYKGFVDAVRTEGSGRTRAGDYLGYWSGGYHITGAPVTATGKTLQVGYVAVDMSLIPKHASLTIPTLKSPWNSRIFTAEDTGPHIVGKHIDVFTGYGKTAEAETYRITGYGNTVCR
jgi:3D (Asp-Asp-Asp) domain-containing protein